MRLNKLSSLKSQARILRKLLKSYKQIDDLVIFGSSVRNKLSPVDLDIAIISNTKSPELVGEIKNVLDKEFDNIHLQFISYEDFVKSKLPYYALLEGYSVKEDDFFSKKLNISRKIIYSFNLNEMTQSKKVLFNRALKNLVKTTKSEKIGRGAVMVPVNSSGEFEDFLKQWGRKINKKEMIQI